MKNIIYCVVLIALFAFTFGAKSPSPTRTPSPVPSASPSSAPSCGGSGNCGLFYSVQDSWYTEDQAPSSNPNQCSFGYDSYTYTQVHYNQFVNKKTVAQYQFDFTTVSPSATITSIELIVPATCCVTPSTLCPSDGYSVYVYKTTPFLETTLIDAPAGWNCTAAPTILGLVDTVTIANGRLVSTSASLLALAQSSVTNGVVTPLAFVSVFAEQPIYLCSKESNNDPVVKLTWV